jgi:hypothetical protein
MTRTRDGKSPMAEGRVCPRCRKWLKSGGHRGPCLFSVTAPPQHILGLFHDRREMEAVVNALALHGRLKWGSGINANDERVVRLADEYREARR